MTVQATEAPIDLAFPTSCPVLTRPIQTAVIGLGRSGITHAAVLSTIPECKVVAVADGRRDARRNLAGLGCKAPGFETVKRLLSKTKPEAVIVSGPPDERVRDARLALEAGAAVMVDGPLGRTLEEGRELERLAQSKGVPLAAAHPIAYHPVFAATQPLISSRALGKLHQVRSSMYLSRVFSVRQKSEACPPNAGGGVLAQAASDLLFLLIWYLGIPTQVRATSNSVYGSPEDELHGMMAMAGGGEMGFDSSWSVPGYPRPATVIECDGAAGKLLASDDALELDLFARRGGAGITRFGHATLPRPGRFDLDGEALYLQDSAFLAWVTGGPAPPNRAEAAIQVTRVIEALYASAKDGGKPAAVPA